MALEARRALDHEGLPRFLSVLEKSTLGVLESHPVQCRGLSPQARPPPPPPAKVEKKELLRKPRP